MPDAQPAPVVPADAYPLITTAHLSAVREFYVDLLGFGVVFEASWFLLLAAPGERSALIGFMRPDHPSAPPGPELFSGQGMIWTIQVQDAAAAYQMVKLAGAAVHYELADEPWGQRRFMLRDPAGLLLDVVEQTQPVQGFWDSYLGPARGSS